MATGAFGQAVTEIVKDQVKRQAKVMIDKEKNALKFEKGVDTSKIEKNIRRKLRLKEILAVA